MDETATLTVIGSGSSGNSYAIRAGGEILLLECGLKKSNILKGISYKTADVVGCFISHEHKDHCGYLKDIQKYGFPIFASENVARRILEMYNIKIEGAKRNASNVLGGFSVVPLQVPHDGVECDGFLVSHRAFGKLIFLTDLEYCPYDLSGLGINIALIECNYKAEYLNDVAYRGHVLSGHMELDTCRRFIEKISNENLRNVVLIHLSNDNADAREFQNTLVNSCPIGCKLSVAYSGLTIDIGGKNQC